VTLGFVEIAAALKFISNVDIVWEWHWLSRELFLALWVAIFIATALYLFGMIRIKDECTTEVSPARMLAGLCFLMLSLYCGYGALGNRLDSIMTAIVLAPFADSEKSFIDLGRLRLQECDRVRALHTELGKCGATIVEEDDTLRITPGPLHGAEIETYNDHRMAMCFAMLGLVVPGIRIRNPECVRKTFPNFFEKLADSPPHGLGVNINETLKPGSYAA